MGDHGQPRGFSSIAGAWVLDLSRSDTMESFLRCLLTPEVAVRAQVATERAHASRNVIALDEHHFVVHKQTGLSYFTERFAIDEEIITQTAHGEKRSRVSLGNDDGVDGIVVATTMPTAGGDVELVEVRQLIDRGVAHAQVLQLRNRSTGKEIVTRRLWNRVPMTQMDQAQLAFV